MKHILLLIIVIFFLFSCKKENKQTFTNDSDNSDDYTVNSAVLESVNKVTINEYRWIIPEVGLRMRVSPELEAAKLTTIPFNERVFLVEEMVDFEVIGGVKGKWSKVNYHEMSGWVFGAYLSKSQGENIIQLEPDFDNVKGINWCYLDAESYKDFKFDTFSIKNFRLHNFSPFGGYLFKEDGTYQSWWHQGSEAYGRWSITNEIITINQHFLKGINPDGGHVKDIESRSERVLEIKEFYKSHFITVDNQIYINLKYFKDLPPGKLEINELNLINNDWYFMYSDDEEIYFDVNNFDFKEFSSNAFLYLREDGTYSEGWDQGGGYGKWYLSGDILYVNQEYINSVDPEGIAGDKEVIDNSEYTIIELFESHMKCKNSNGDIIILINQDYFEARR